MQSILPLQHWLITAIAAAGLAILRSSHAAEDVPVDVHMRTAAEELTTITLPPGYHLELVASDPDLICPVLCERDGDGRMYLFRSRNSLSSTPLYRYTALPSPGGIVGSCCGELTGACQGTIIGVRDLSDSVANYLPLTYRPENSKRR